MTVVVFVILAVIWAAVLVPPYLQNRRESRPGDSIASFRAQLSVLERTTPGYRRRPPGSPGRPVPARSRVAAARGAAGGSRGPVGGTARGSVPAAPAGSGAVGRSAMSSRAAVAHRAEQRRRRRDVFLTLLAAVGLTFVLALVLGGPVWGLHLVVDVAFLGYVGLLIQIQQRTAERDMKVRYLRPQPAPARARMARQPEPGLLLRRSAN